MNTIALVAAGNRLSISGTAQLTGGSRYKDECMFIFDNEWIGCTEKIAVFATAKGDEYTEFIRNNKCLIPEECLQKSGLLKIGVIGKGSGNDVLSTNFVTHKITRGANENSALIYRDESFNEAGSNLEYVSFDNDSISLDSYSTDFSIDETETETETGLDELCAFYPSYAQKITAENDFEYYEFKSAQASKTVVLKINSDFTREAAAEFIGDLCRRSGTNGIAGRLFSDVRFIIFSGENYEAFFNGFDTSKIIFAADVDTLQITPLGKAVVFTKTSDEKSLLDAAERFDCIRNETGTAFLKKSGEGFAGFMSENFCVNSCSLAWNSDNEDSENLAVFLKTIIYSQVRAGKYPGMNKPASFTKHICWRSSGAGDTFALGSDIETMWLSLYKTNLGGFYDITLSGYALVRSQSGGIFTLRPVLYQENVDKQSRFADTAFDTECSLNQGITSVAFSGVIYGNYSVNQTSGGSFPEELGAVLRAKVEQGDAEIIGFSYTLSAVASDGNQTEILVPQGLVSDYDSEDDPPVFMVKSFIDGSEELE